jgi:ABC-type transport system substrate-binding protein
MRAWFVAVIVNLMLLAACGGEKEPVPAGGETGQAQREPSGELRIVSASPETLDPALTGDVNSSTYVLEIFDGLVTLDRDLKVVPNLAERWEISGDGRVYTFFLRRNASFHSGRPVNAHDFKYSIERATHPALKSHVAPLYLGDIVGVADKLAGRASEVEGVQVMDDYSIRITIDAPKAFFLAKLTAPVSFVVDRDQITSNPQNWIRAPNGTGPFKLTEWQLNERIVLEANPSYHLGAPGVARVVFLLGGRGVDLFEQDQADIAAAGVLPPEKRAALAPQMFSSQQLSITSVGFNLRVPPFDDLKVRQAFTMAIDRNQLVTRVLNDTVAGAQGVLPPGMPGFNPNLQAISFDPARARQLLAESRYAGSLPRITFVSPTQGQAEQALVEMWRQNLGVEVQVSRLDLTNINREVEAGRAHLFNFGWVADYPDPENFLDILFHSRSSGNQTKYSNPQVDRLLEQARGERNNDQRYALYRQAEQIVVNEAAWLPLFHGRGSFLVKPRVKGYVRPPLLIPHLRFVTVE